MPPPRPCHARPPAPRGAARPAHHRRGAARKIRQGRRAHRPTTSASASRALAPGRGAGAAHGVEAKFLDAQQRGSSPLGASAGRGHGAVGDADQPLRAAGGRLDRPHGRGPPGHLHRAHRGRGDDARGGGVATTLAHPPAGGLGRRHESSASGPVSWLRVFDRSCETVESAGSRRGRRWACCAATIRTSRSSSTPRTAATCRTSTSRSASPTPSCRPFSPAARSNSCTAPSPAHRKGRGAYQRADGQWVYRKLPARRLWRQIMQSTYDHAGARRSVPRPHQRRQQPRLLRDDREHQPVRRAAAAALWLLLPRLGRPDAFVRAPVRDGAAFDFAVSPTSATRRGPDARQRARRHVAPCRSSWPSRAASAASAWASPASATRW